MPAAARISELHDLFYLRRHLARIGEADWLRWWNSNALTDAGRYAMGRLFRRTPDLSAAHLAIAAARVRHDEAVPNEPLVHLFNLGEEHEGAFERWLIGQKAEGWTPDVPPRPLDEQKRSAAAALQAVGVTPAELTTNGNATLALGTIPPTALSTAKERLQVARRLAAAYTASEPERLVVPFFRLER